MRPVVYPADWLFRPEPPPLSDFGRRMLGEGDSWFTIGTLNLAAASNVLFKLEVTTSTAIVNCAYPGDTLGHMVERMNDPYFDKLLRRRNFASYWEGLLVSAGGNDLIDAAQVPPRDAQGQPITQDKRLLLTPSEADAAGPTGQPERYISAPGWETLSRYLRVNFEILVARRDEGPSAGRPIFIHTYAAPVVRQAGTVGAPDGWLWPAFEAAGIPIADRQAVSDQLFDRLRQLLKGLDCATGVAPLPHVHVFDSAGLTNITAAAPGDRDSSGDWVNEIHLTPDGYRKLGAAFGPFFEGVLRSY